MKVVFNACYGGFGLSPEAVFRYAEIKGIKLRAFTYLSGGGIVPYDGKTKTKPVLYFTSPTPDDDFSWDYDNIDRTDPALVQVVEELGERANGDCAELSVADVPAGTKWRIDEYDGRETVMTVDDYAWNVAT